MVLRGVRRTLSWAPIIPRKSKDMQTPSPLSQKWSDVYERCGMCWNEWKINVYNFYFSSYGWIFIESWPYFEYKMTITRKIKIVKLIFHSFQHIPHLSCKFEHFWKKIYLFWNFLFVKYWKIVNNIFYFLNKYIFCFFWWGFAPHQKKNIQGLEFVF